MARVLKINYFLIVLPDLRSRRIRGSGEYELQEGLRGMQGNQDSGRVLKGVKLQMQKGG